MKIVYLGGTITPAPEHMEWRKRVKEWACGQYYDPILKCLVVSPYPTRCLVIDPTDRNDMANVSKDGLHDHTMPDSLFVRADIADIERCDVLMVVYWKGRHENREGLRRQSIGTWMEMGIAAYLHKPIIVVTDDPQVFDYPFVTTFAAGRYNTIEEALKALEVLVR